MKNKIENLLCSGTEISLIEEKCKPSWTPVWIYLGIVLGISIITIILILICIFAIVGAGAMFV